jgi:dimethylamine---corrinoid protein Co-methyltransferase
LEPKIPTRMGDGSLVEMTRSEIKADLEEGTQIAAKRAKVPELTQDEIDHLLDIYASPARFTAVDIGEEVILSNDGTGTKHIGNRVQDLQSYETLLGVDMPELWQADYSYKAVKTNVAHEGQSMKIAQALLTNPVQYGAMPDLGRYSKPDGRSRTGPSCCRWARSTRLATRRSTPARCWSRTSTSSPTP